MADTYSSLQNIPVQEKKNNEVLPGNSKTDLAILFGNSTHHIASHNTLS